MFSSNTLELKQFRKFENGRMVTYGYSIERDRKGAELKVLSSIGWGDGASFTKNDYGLI